MEESKSLASEIIKELNDEMEMVNLKLSLIEKLTKEKNSEKLLKINEVLK